MVRFVFFLGTLFAFSLSAQGIDLDQVEKDLTGAGLVGRIHGAAHDLRQVVFTYREPGNFFNHMEFSLIPTTAAARTELAKVSRHDAVRIQGRFAPNPSKQIHIRVAKVEILEVYDPQVPVPPFKREAELPKDLLAGSSLLATVHAVAAEGEILVIEYKDAIVPVFVEDSKWTQDLFRGDKVRIHYEVASTPRLPTHLKLDSTHPRPVEVTVAIRQIHEQDIVLEGPLVYFPKSPMLRFGVFAIQTKDADGLKVNYTLINFDDPAVFEAIRTKLDTLWKSDKSPVVNNRNSLIKPSLRIRATGLGNMVSPSQANPQVLLTGPDSIEVL